MNIKWNALLVLGLEEALCRGKNRLMRFLSLPVLWKDLGLDGKKEKF